MLVSQMKLFTVGVFTPDRFVQKKLLLWNGIHSHYPHYVSSVHTMVWTLLCGKGAELRRQYRKVKRKQKGSAWKLCFEKSSHCSFSENVLTFDTSSGMLLLVLVPCRSKAALCLPR